MQHSMGAKSKVLLIVLLLFCLSVLAIQAGSTLDYGQLPSTPPSVNFTAWVSPAVPPSQVITEDAYNSASGPDQGYQGGYWLVANRLI